MKLLGLFAFALIIAASESCEAPRRWTALGLSFDYSLRFFSRGRIFYDAENERVRYITRIDFNSTKDLVDNIYLFKEKTYYRYDAITDKCEKKATPRNFIPVEVEKDSTFVGEAWIGLNGAPDEGISTQAYRHESSERVREQVFTTQLCLPVSDSIFGTLDGIEVHEHFQYFDISDLHHPDEAFKLPEKCAML